jgi:hypothetical protein
VFMMISFDELAKEILGAKKLEKNVFGFLAEEYGRSPETVKDWYQEKKRIPMWAALKMERLLFEEGFEWIKEFKTIKQVNALSWRIFCEPHPDQKRLFPNTLDRINNLARRDFEFCLSLLAKNVAEQSLAHKEYLASEVIPEYCRDPEMASAFRVASEAEIEPLLTSLLIGGICDHLAYAEAEYLSSHLNEQTSILAHCLPEFVNPNVIITPKEKYFRRWFADFALNAGDVVAAVVKKYGEIGTTDEDPEEAVNIEVVARELRWALTDKKDEEEKRTSRSKTKMGEVHWPPWQLVEKIAAALYPFAKQRGSEITEEEYCQKCILGVAGARIMDTALRDGIKILPAEKTLSLFEKYPARFQAHLDSHRDKGASIYARP